MSSNNLLIETRTVYEKHGWRLRRLLLTPAAKMEIDTVSFPKDVSIIEAEINAMWFSRPSHNGREAWELRLLSEQPYALFETFEPDETEDEREERMQEMERQVMTND